MKRQQLLDVGMIDGSVTRLSRDEHCPYCHAELTATSDTTGRASPKPGDLALCGDCGGMLIFDDRLHQRCATQEELDALGEEERRDLREAQRIIARANNKETT